MTSYEVIFLEFQKVSFQIYELETEHKAEALVQRHFFFTVIFRTFIFIYYQKAFGNRFREKNSINRSKYKMNNAIKWNQQKIENKAIYTIPIL